MTFSPFNRVLQSCHAAHYLPKTLAIRQLSVLDAFVEFWSQFYTNKCADLSALWHKMAAHTPQTWSQFNGGSERSDSPENIILTAAVWFWSVLLSADYVTLSLIPDYLKNHTRLIEMRSLRYLIHVGRVALSYKRSTHLADQNDATS